MAKSAAKSAAKAIILGKREQEDGFETRPIRKRHKEKSDEKESVEGSADSLQLIKRMVELLETKSKQANLISKKETVEGIDEPPNFVEEVAARQKTLFVTNLSWETKISDIIDFFNSVGEVVRVQLIVDRKGLLSGFGFVDFASANEAKKALEKKNGEWLCGRKIYLDLAKISPYTPRRKYGIDHKVVWYEDYLRREGLLIEENETVDEHDEDPDSAEVFIRKKTLFVANLSPQTKILDVCNFFHNVGQVVSVRLIVNHEGRHVGYGFVEFFSANEAKKALEKKGEYLHDHKIYLDVVKIAPCPPQPKYKDLEDYLRRESPVIEEDETVEGLDEDPNSAEEFIRKKTLFVANLSPQTEILDICKFFHNVGEVAHVRLIVDDNGEHDGYGFVEFASAIEAKKALEKKNGGFLHDCRIVLAVAKKAKYLPPKYCINHKVWFEDYLRRESLLIEENETVEGLVEEVVARKKTLFVANLPPQTEILDVCNFFHNTGKIVSQRVIVNHEGEHVGCGFLEFASAHEAKKALEKKQGDYLHHHKIFLDVAKIAPYPPRPKYNLAEKLWYEDYLRQESLLIEEVDWKTKPIPRFCGTKTTFADDEEAF